MLIRRPLDAGVLCPKDTEPDLALSKIRRPAATRQRRPLDPGDAFPPALGISSFRGSSKRGSTPKVGHPREDAIFPVHLQPPQNDLAAQMGDMRAWLDRYNVEPSGFSYREGVGCLVACLEFRVKRQAEGILRVFCQSQSCG
jgi:hypothetical protein